MRLHFLEYDFSPKKLCSIEPMTMAAIGLGVGGGMGAIGNILGGNKQAKAIKDAMNQYISYRTGEREKYLANPEVGAIRSRLSSFIPGSPGYNSDPYASDPVARNYQDEFSKGVNEVTRASNKAGVSGGVYSPGRRERTIRLMGENLTAKKAQGIRDMQTNNERFAISSLPTSGVLPGDPAHENFSPSVFQSLNTPNMGGPEALSNVGGSVSQAALLYGLFGPRGAQQGPIQQRMAMAGPYSYPTGRGGWEMPPPSPWT